MRIIPLTQGKVALVDDDLFDYLNQWKWHYAKGYAVHSLKRVDNEKSRLYMHRIINNTPIGMDTDHIDRNKLNNQRVNLRTVTRTINNLNRGAVGVNYHKASKKWRAHIQIYKKQLHLGLFNSREEALTARENKWKLLSQP